MKETEKRKTDRFMSELRTASWIRRIARERGYVLSIQESHEAWSEHSDDYCASWLSPDLENPKAEAWQAITKWRARRGLKP